MTDSALNFNNRNLQEIPASILEDERYKRTLLKLHLRKNCINRLTPKLCNLKSLTTLYLTDNNLTKLSHVVSQLPCLSIIDVSQNEIASLSPSLGEMSSLTELNLSNNKLTRIPHELWKAPKLQCLNVSANSLWKLSPEIVRCQSLKKLLLDDNVLTWLPSQITGLLNLELLSLSGNKLTALPNDFSKLSRLSQLLVHMNTGISHIPISLSSVFCWGVLGVSGCSATVSDDELAYVKPIHTCNHSVPPLIELSARYIHQTLKECLSDSVTLYLPKELCSLLNLPSSLSDWLVPRGTCYLFSCRSVYFKHYCSKQVSGSFCINNSNRGMCRPANIYINSAKGLCRPSNLALSVDFCSFQCVLKYFKSHEFC